MNGSQTIITGFDPHGSFGLLYLPLRFRKRIKETRFKQEWKLTWAQYIQMMQEFKGPKCQRGIVIATAIFPTPAPAGFVVLNNHSGAGRFFDERFSAGTAEASAEFENDGQLWERNIVNPDTQQNGEWWSNEPEASKGNDFAVRALSAGKVGVWSATSVVDNVWTTMTVTRFWRRNRTSTGTSTVSATFEVGPQPTGPADDSATIECRATVDDL